MQVPVDDRVARRGTQGGRLVEQLPYPAGRRPQAGRFERGEPVAGPRDADLHVGAKVEVDREAGADLVDDIGGVQGRQERAERRAVRRPRGAVERYLRELAAGQEPRAEERPREPFRRPADVDGHRDRQRQAPREPRKDEDLALDPGDRDRPPREAERELAVHEPDRVVPAPGERTQVADDERRDLLGEQLPHPRLVDVDLRVPFRHRVRVARRWPSRRTAVLTVGTDRPRLRCPEPRCPNRSMLVARS